ncbi:hypothetical protein LGQ02_19390 [Bacillus shivajii]|uniref:hypothetical protein n=1 Tax=Bacillus shivajii TaxID=1983719 RepID=UPI001CFA51AA|nr:hypothetical protein [Bacillus shivajii]UCZ52919.1 hypothetical protein LGQ02_19390 [Bacillus shivajii]
MKVLSNAGQLYLNEYYALKHAEHEVNKYLDNLTNHTYQYIVTHCSKLEANQYTWNCHHSKPGRIELYPYFSNNQGIFESDKVELSVLYRDVRDYDDMEKTESVRLSIYCRKALKEKLNKLPETTLNKASQLAEKHGIKIQVKTGKPLFYMYIDLDLGDVEKSAKVIGEDMIRIGKGLDTFIDGIIEDNS